MTQSDGHYPPGLVGKVVPGECAEVDDLVIRAEDTVRQPVLSHELPDVLDGIEFGAFWRKGQQGDVAGNVQLPGGMPTGLVEHQHGMRAGLDGLRYLGEVQRHRLCIAPGQDKAGALAQGRTDRAEDVRRLRALVLRGRGPAAAFGPSSSNLVLLADPRLVLPPDFYRLARVRLPDFLQAGGEVFLKAASACSFWA